MHRECFKCGTNEGNFIPAPGSEVDNEGIPLDVICENCYNEIANRVDYAGGLHRLSHELTGEELLEMQREYAALQQNY